MSPQRQTLLRLLQWRFALTAEVQAHYAHQFARIDTLEQLIQLVDQALIRQTLAEFDQALRAFLPSGEVQP